MVRLPASVLAMASSSQARWGRSRTQPAAVNRAASPIRTRIGANTPHSPSPLGTSQRARGRPGTDVLRGCRVLYGLGIREGLGAGVLIGVKRAAASGTENYRHMGEFRRRWREWGVEPPMIEQPERGKRVTRRRRTGANARKPRKESRPPPVPPASFASAATKSLSFFSSPAWKRGQPQWNRA